MKKGDRINFLKPVYEPADGDHPQFILCAKGDFGTVERVFSDGSVMCFWDRWTKESFECKADEFEVVE